MRLDYKYPRTMDEAFPGHGDYACALEVPVKRVRVGYALSVVCIALLLTWIFV